MRIMRRKSEREGRVLDGRGAGGGGGGRRLVAWFGWRCSGEEARRVVACRHALVAQGLQFKCPAYSFFFFLIFLLGSPL